MKKIKLTQNKYALVDDENFEWLDQWKWHYNNGYAMRRKHIKGRKSGIYILMHNLINGTPKGLDTDHVDRDRLNNQRSNLRTVTHQQNAFNAKLNLRNTSGYKGVSLDKVLNKWKVYIILNDKYIHLGRFLNLEDAILVRAKAERTYHGI